MSSQSASRRDLVVTVVLVLAMAVAWTVTGGGSGASAAGDTPVVAAADVLGAFEVPDDYLGSGGGIYARYEGIDGEAVEDNHTDWIEALSAEWGAHVGVQAGTTAARVRTPEVDGFTLTFVYDKSVPKLADKLLRGSVIPKLEVEFTRDFESYGATYLRYELENVTLVDYAMAGKTDRGYPVVRFVSTFEKAKVTYTQYAGDGSGLENVEYEYDGRH